VVTSPRLVTGLRDVASFLRSARLGWRPDTAPVGAIICALSFVGLLCGIVLFQYTKSAGATAISQVADSSFIASLANFFSPVFLRNRAWPTVSCVHANRLRGPNFRFSVLSTDEGILREQFRLHSPVLEVALGFSLACLIVTLRLESTATPNASRRRPPPR